ncbi:amidohydrolase family protein [Microbacterium sp.]|uniref:amidohydrolase family protein n=1 Tax=Microbacterium sp. TaxID=51671 RepID=UPI0039E6C77E
MNTARDDQTTAFVNARVFLPDGTLAPRTVLVRGGLIDGVIDADSPLGAEIVTIDCAGRTIVPGLIDLHAHPSAHARLDKDRAVDQTIYSVRHALRLLRAGVTTIRALGGAGRADRVLDELGRQGLIAAPRIVSAGHFLCITGGHASGNGIEVDGADALRKAVRAEVRDGHRWVKLMCSGGFDHAEESPSAMQFSPAEVRAACEEAEALGVRVAAHAHGSAPIIMASEAGVDSIEHGSFVDRDAARAMRDNDVFLVPTFSIYDNVAARVSHPTKEQSAALAEPKRRSLEVAIEEGVAWGLGSDAQGGSPLELLLDEIIILVEKIGLSPADAIAKASRGNAELLGLDGVGSIERGYVADLVVIDGDPLADIQNIARVVGTVSTGRYYDWEAIAPSLNLWTLETLDVPDAPDGRRTPSRLWDLHITP